MWQMASLFYRTKNKIGYKFHSRFYVFVNFPSKTFFQSYKGKSYIIFFNHGRF